MNEKNFSSVTLIGSFDGIHSPKRLGKFFNVLSERIHGSDAMAYSKSIIIYK